MIKFRKEFEALDRFVHKSKGTKLVVISTYDERIGHF